jgi:Flp pilus assembly protein TadG
MLRMLSRIMKGRESGQALLLFAAGLVAFLGLVGMSVDVGRFVWARTSIQAGVDAAALAAAQSMPSTSDATAKAIDYYSKNNGSLKSADPNVDSKFEVTFPPGNKALAVHASANIPTYFLRIFGIDHWTVSADGSAASQVLDIAVVLDISGSMCYDPPFLHTESTESTLMSPGASAKIPHLTQAVSASGGSSTTLYLDSNFSIFDSTNSGTNSSNFGSSFSNLYKDQSIGGRKGIIAIAGSSGGYELFQITGQNTANKTLTVTRAVQNKYSGAWTSKLAHSNGAEVWANRTGCDKASTSGTGPFEPFDTAIYDAQEFTTLFNAGYDKIGLVKYSTTASKLAGLTSNFATLQSTLGAIPYPNGSTNTAHGIGLGRQVLDGSGKRANSARVIVLVTDGIPNLYCTNSSAYDTSASCTTGSSATSPTSCSPNTTAMTAAISQAAAAQAEQITVYTIGLGDGVLDCVLTQVAAAGSGSYFKAPTAADLGDAFKSIAELTHIALTK